jgi:hypothetical protein
MAKIAGDSLTVEGIQRPDASWLFTIRYTVEFERGEVGQQFDDSVQISTCCGAAPVSFLACGPAVLRKKRLVVDGYALTCLDEHNPVYATVCLRRRGGLDVLTRSTRLSRALAETLPHGR